MHFQSKFRYACLTAAVSMIGEHYQGTRFRIYILLKTSTKQKCYDENKVRFHERNLLLTRWWNRRTNQFSLTRALSAVSYIKPPELIYI